MCDKQERYSKASKRVNAVQVNPPANVRRPWTATLRTTIAGLIAAIPIMIELAKHLSDTYNWGWLAQFIIFMGIISRVLNSATFEAWAARYAPWLSIGCHDEPGPPGRHAKQD